MNSVQVSPDTFAVPLNEEVAAPASIIAPTKLSERIAGMDVLRGVALLGILVMNIDGFGNPGFVHDIPVGTPINNFAGPYAHLNLALLMIKWMFFEGKMRGFFSMLFGAGVILLTSRAERRGSMNAADSYIATALIGSAVSMPIYTIGILKAYASGFYFLDMDKWLWLPYYLTRETGSLAIAATVILIVKSGVLKMPQRLLAAVGRTAFSNYILTSLLCQTLFVWGPWKLYGKLEYYQLMYAVFGVWAINLVVSSLWLRKFAFGPLEWVWRSLTYGVARPMRIEERP